MTASPSLRNSGFEATANGCEVADATAAWTLAAVPTGTVLLVTITVKPVSAAPICLAAASTWPRSALPSSPEGVPTAMNTISAPATASGVDVVNRRRSRPALRLIRSWRPGS